MTHSFKPGDDVAIINSTLGGRFFVEASAARIVKCHDTDEYYEVTIAGMKVDRFVDPAAQANPKAFADKLNAKP